MKQLFPLLSMLVASAAFAAPTGIQNGGFETNVVSNGSYLYAADAGFGVPTVASGTSPAANWTFSGLTGVLNNSAAFPGSQAAPEGQAYAFVQSYSASGVTGSISQSFTLDTAVSALNVAFDSVQRNYGSLAQNLTVSVLDGSTQLASQTYNPSHSWGSYSLAVGGLSAGTYTLQFSGVQGLPGDRTVFIDKVSLQATAAVPEADAQALALAGVGVVGLVLRRRRTQV